MPKFMSKFLKLLFASNKVSEDISFSIFYLFVTIRRYTKRMGFDPSHPLSFSTRSRQAPFTFPFINFFGVIKIFNL